MQRASSSRGGTSMEYAIVLGILGSVIILLTGIGVRKIEIANAMREGGAICR